MSDITGKLSGEVWILIGSGIGMALAAVLLALLGAIRGWLYSFVPKMIAKFKSYPNKKDADKNHLIYTALVELRTMVDADRAYVVRFHNGDEFVPDNPVWKITCTHETVRSGITYEASKTQGIVVSRIHHIIDPMLTGDDSKYSGVQIAKCEMCDNQVKCGKDNRRVIVIQTNEMGNSYGKFVLDGRNAKTVVQAGMVDNKKVIGIVGVDFCDYKMDVASVEEIVKKVCQMAEKIHYYLCG